ncbi:MAG: glycosyltransferase [Minisyncoccota bacterium]
MRIAFFSDNFYPELSGISDSIITTGAELVRRGHQVVYVAPRYTNHEYEIVHIDPRETIPAPLRGTTATVISIPSFPVPSSPTKQSRFAIPWGTSIAPLRSFRPDVIHTQSPFGVGIEALRASKRLSVPLVGTNHTIIEEFVPTTPLIGATVASALTAYYAWYYHHMSYLTAPYEELLKTSAKTLRTPPSCVLPNPVELSQFHLSDQQARTTLKQKLGITGPLVIYAGRLAPEKRVDEVLKTLPVLIKKFPSLIYAIVGHGTSENDLKKMAKQLGVSAHVRFTGYLGKAELAEWYTASDVFFTLSTSETQCLALMEAFASGLPAVVARAGALASYTPASSGFLVDPGDTASAAHHITTLLTDETRRRAMGIAAHNYIQAFSPAHIAQQWESIYDTVIRH